MTSHFVASPCGHAVRGVGHKLIYSGPGVLGFVCG